MRLSQTGGVEVSYEGHNDIPYHASFSPDGSQVVSCSEDGAIRVGIIYCSTVLFLQYRVIDHDLYILSIDRHVDRQFDSHVNRHVFI